MEMTPEELDEQFGDYEDVEWQHDGEDCFPYVSLGMEDDADALASAGFGTDEDYWVCDAGDDW